MKYVILFGLIIALSSCANLRQHTKDIFLYQQTIILAIVDVLYFGDVNEDTEDELYAYEEMINEDCGALQSVAIQKMRGEEPSIGLKKKIVDNLDKCEHSIQKAELYLVSKGFDIRY